MVTIGFKLSLLHQIYSIEKEPLIVAMGTNESLLLYNKEL